MSWIIDLSCIVFLIILAVQDFRQRQFSWLLVPALLIVLIIKGVSEISIKELATYFLLNSVFVILQLLLITLYFSLRNKKLINIVNTSLGIGDVLFFFVICAAFAPVNFIHFYLSGLIFALFTYLIYRLFKPNTNHEIPLAGLMAAWLIVFLTYMRFAGHSFYDDTSLVNFYLNG